MKHWEGGGSYSPPNRTSECAQPAVHLGLPWGETGKYTTPRQVCYDTAFLKAFKEKLVGGHVSFSPMASVAGDAEAFLFSSSEALSKCY